MKINEFCSKINDVTFDMCEYEKFKIQDQEKVVNDFIEKFLSSKINKDILLFGNFHSYKKNNEYIEFIAMIIEESNINIYSERFDIIDYINDKHHKSIKVSTKLNNNRICIEKRNKIELLNLNSDLEDFKLQKIKDFLNYIIVKINDFENDDIEFKIFVKNNYSLFNKYNLKYQCIYNIKNKTLYEFLIKVVYCDIPKNNLSFSDKNDDITIHHDLEISYSKNEIWKFLYYNFGIYKNYEYNYNHSLLFDGEVIVEANDKDKLHIIYKNELFYISSILNYFNESFEPSNDKKIITFNKLQNIENFIKNQIFNIRSAETNGWIPKILKSFIYDNILILRLYLIDNKKKNIKIIIENYISEGNCIRQVDFTSDNTKIKNLEITNFIKSYNDGINDTERYNATFSINLLYENNNLYETIFDAKTGSLLKLYHGNKSVDKDNSLVYKYDYEINNKSIIDTKKITNKSKNIFIKQYVDFLYHEIFNLK